MKKLFLFLVPALAALPLSAKDLGVKTQAKIEITTNTSYGVNLDDPREQGLRMDFSHFNIQFNLANGGLLSNKITSDDPQGFVQFEFGGLQFNWGNTSSLFDKDLNNPGKNTNLGFNGADTGYAYPIYIERFQSGIQWHAWDGAFVFQLAAGGDQPENWRPWSNILRGSIQSQFLQRWAFLDTRVQYLRASLPAYLTNNDMGPTGIPDDSNYWRHGEAYDVAGIERDLSLNPAGTLVGLQFNHADFSVMAKFITELTWADSHIQKVNSVDTDFGMNGMGVGLDLVLAPADLKGLRAYGSVGKTFNYGVDTDPQALGYGGKIGYDLPLGDPFSFEPYVGFMAKTWDKTGSIGTTRWRNAMEASAGFTLHWPGNGGWQWDPLEQRNGVSFPGFTAAYTVRDNNAQYFGDQIIGTEPIHSVLLTLFEESGDYGLVPGLGASMAVQMIDLLNRSTSSDAVKDSISPSSKILATTYLDYTFVDLVPGELVPWTRVYYDYLTRPSNGEVLQNVKVDAGLKLAKAVRNTVFGLTYESKNLTAAVKDTAHVDAYNGAYGLGIVRAWIEVSL